MSKTEYKNKKVLKSIMVIVSIIGILLIGVKYFNKNYIYTDTIANNIYIDGIDVSLLTKDEALQKLKDEVDVEDITLKYKADIYTLKASEFDLRYNFEDAINKAYKYTKTDDYVENIKRYFDLRENSEEFDLKILYDEVKLSKLVEDISNIVNIKVKDASIYISNTGNIASSKSITGRELDVVSTKEKIYDMIQKKNHEVIDLKVNEITPSVKTEDVNSINSLLAKYTTKFSTKDSNRVTNIEISAKKTSDILLMPGEEFSYNTLTGRRVKANGYKDAPVIINGKLEQDVGGGVCQVSSTMFNSVMYSGLDITSRRNHSLKSSYVPIGQDAMVSDGGSDFRFENPYDHPVYIKNFVNGGSITTKIYGNNKDKKNIKIVVEEFKENGLEAAKTYIQYQDKDGNVISSKYISKSVYKKPK